MHVLTLRIAEGLLWFIPGRFRFIHHFTENRFIPRFIPNVRFIPITGLFMVYSWFIHGLFMVYSWFIPGC